MRATLLAIALLLSTAARAEEAKPAPKLPADAESCLMCHDKGGGAPEVDFKAFPGSVHGQAEVGCTDCHAGYKEGPHEGELPALSAAEQATVARLAKGAWGEGEAKHGVTAPRAYLACQSCHTTEAEAFAKSVHGKWLAQDTKAPGATCASCHGSPHALPAKLAEYAPKDGKRVPVPADRREMTKRCEACHGNEAFAEAAGLDPEAVITYHDSIHGRLTRVGNAAAPTCVSCHAAAPDAGGTHAILSKTDPASTVSAANKKQACARCHAGATDTFAGLVAHKPLHETGGSVIPHLVHVAFSWLTTLTLLFFAFHVLVDFVYELRSRLAKKAGHGPSADAVRSVIRFDIHQRIQHWFMLSGVILLGITGWPLRGAGDAEAATYSRAFMKVFGGAEGAATWHRVGAVLIIISAAYHLFYLTFLASKKRLPLSMLPVPKDALDMRDNILFMMGVKKERPKFDRYMYLEKFDYWAVFWGIVMMVGTGFIFWFPVWFASWAPGWLITAAQIIHGEEATLAILFLFTVHFYNVHLKPSIFPMNWAWLNGRISVEAMKHEHPLEYDRLKDDL
ncbi:cytochrome b/b6 domain-containing protein [Anaeromyxobacter dehalogenans]|nr:cytochrome b/b6 domain-containing protein [Anaeromyxobacter dehalogenans]